jgi:glutaredoxin
MRPRVTLYVKAGCLHCDAKRRELRDRGVDLVEVSVTANPEVTPELLKLTKGARRVPVIVAGGRIAIAPDGGSDF